MGSASRCGNRFLGAYLGRGKTADARASLQRGVVLAAVALLLACSATPYTWAVVVTDDFSDLNDTSSPTWTHLDGEVGSTGQTWDASSGAYHVVAPGNSEVSGVEGYGFGGSYTGPTFTDVRVSADIVDFPNIGFQGTYFAVAARLNGDNSLPSPGVGLPLRGYSYQYEANANTGRGEMVLNLVYGDGLKDLRSQKGIPIDEPMLDNTKDYRVIFEMIGNVMHGQVFELDGSGNIVQQVAEQFRNLDAEPVGLIDHDGDNTTPQVEFNPADFASGYSGVYVVGHAFLADGDTTFDNFRTETAVAGDYNRNGAADAADYVLWRKTLGNASPTSNPPTGFSDMRANGDVSAGELSQVIDQGDYAFWRSKFGSAVSGSGVGAGAAVPEPSAALMVVIGLLSLCCRRASR